jgi:hypothetical protein
MNWVTCVSRAVLPKTPVSVKKKFCGIGDKDTPAPMSGTFANAGLAVTRRRQLVPVNVEPGDEGTKTNAVNVLPLTSSSPMFVPVESKHPKAATLAACVGIEFGVTCRDWLPVRGFNPVFALLLSPMFAQNDVSLGSKPQCSVSQVVGMRPAIVQTLSAADAQPTAHVPAAHAWTPLGGSVTAQRLPHVLQFVASVCRFTQAVGLVAGQGCVAEPAFARQVPVEHVIHPVAASGQAVLQQTLPMQLPLMQSPPATHAPPGARFARQAVPPEQKNPGAQGRLALQVVAHAVAEAHPKPLQLVEVPDVQVCDVEQLAAGTNVTADAVAVQVAPAHLLVQLPHVSALSSEVSHPAALVQSARLALQVCTQVPVEQLAVAPGAEVHDPPQAPQFVAVLVLVSQPRSGLPAQCAKPVEQALWGMTQAPAVHWTPAEVRTFISVVQL